MFVLGTGGPVLLVMPVALPPQRGTRGAPSGRLGGDRGGESHQGCRPAESLAGPPHGVQPPLRVP